MGKIRLTIIDRINGIFKVIYKTLENNFANKKLLKGNSIEGNIQKMNNLMINFYKNKKLIITDIQNIEKVTFYASDGRKLSGILYEPNKKSNKWLIASHWFAGHKYWSLYHAKVFAKLGYNIFSFDFRNHGESESDFETMGFLEIRDLMGAIEFLTQTKKPKILGLMGTSMGGYAASYVNVEFGKELRNKHNLKFVISDVPYSSFESLLIHVRNLYLKIIRKSNIKKYLDSLEKNIKKNVIDFSMKEMNIILKYKNGKIPAAPQLFMHGKNDKTTPHADSLEMAFYHSKFFYKDEIQIYNYSPHTQATRVHFPEHTRAIIKFENSIIHDNDFTTSAINFFELEKIDYSKLLKTGDVTIDN
ncbi:hypothetical protein [Spiroplasma endosymbiont of Labia minor]|uniref:alpha/beta hydrolase n=1 Tax=Spiroplasma endosymbiont of Labia minor TaxID=3066305 RepID=UPI0030CEA6DB